MKKKYTNGLQGDHCNILFTSNHRNCHLNSINSSITMSKKISIIYQRDLNGSTNFLEAVTDY